MFCGFPPVAIQNFCEGEAAAGGPPAGVLGQSPQRGPGAESLVEGSGEAPQKAEHFVIRQTI